MMTASRKLIIFLGFLVVVAGLLFFGRDSGFLSKYFPSSSSELLVSEFSKIEKQVGKVEEQPLLSSADFLRKAHLSGLQLAERLDLVTLALDDGTIDSLALLSPDSLDKFAGYDPTLLPAIKSILLDAFLKRFGIFDRGNWATIQTGNATPTAASIFVSDVYRTNPQLGRYLNSAAHLFSGLEYSTSIGSPFDLNAAAEFLYKEFSAKQVEVSHSFDKSIVADESFTRRFESERAHLIMLYLQHNPNDTAAHVRMLRTVKVSAVSKVFVELLQDHLRYLGTSAPAAVRLSFLSEELQESAIERFNKLIPSLDKILAKLFVLGALDLADKGDRVEASAFVRHSTRLAPGLRSQRMVRAMLLPKSDSALKESRAKKPIEKFVSTSVLAVEESGDGLEPLPEEVSRRNIEALKGEDKNKARLEDVGNKLSEKLADIEERIEDVVKTGVPAVVDASRDFSPSIVELIAAEQGGSTSILLTGLLGIIVIGFPIMLMVMVGRYRVRALGAPEVQEPPEFSISPDWHNASAENKESAAPVSKKPARDLSEFEFVGRDSEAKKSIQESIEVERGTTVPNDDSMDEDGPFRLGSDERPVTRTITPRPRRRS